MPETVPITSGFGMCKLPYTGPMGKYALGGTLFVLEIGCDGSYHDSEAAVVFCRCELVRDSHARSIRMKIIEPMRQPPLQPPRYR